MSDEVVVSEELESILRITSPASPARWKLGNGHGNGLGLGLRRPTFPVLIRSLNLHISQGPQGFEENMRVFRAEEESKVRAFNQDAVGQSGRVDAGGHTV